MEKPGITMIAGFSGWNDAGDAASMAIEHCWDRWDAKQFAALDPEEFTDFTVNRPQIRVEAGLVEELIWPETRFGWCRPGGHPVILVSGPEPQFRWHKYCAELLEAADKIGCTTVITIGAMLSDVPHTRDTPVFSNAHSEEALDRVSLPASQYEGPTGIPAVLHSAVNHAGLEALSLWAAVPAYAATVESPLAALALVRESAKLIGADGEIEDLREASKTYVEQLDELCADDDDTADYVRRLEEAYDEDSVQMGSGGELVQEVEKFLRDQ